MNSFGKYLKSLRGQRSLREIDRLSGVSHTYLSSLEKGKDPRTGHELLPTRDVLRKLASAYGVAYIDLLIKADYLTLDEVLTVRKEHGIHD